MNRTSGVGSDKLIRFVRGELPVESLADIGIRLNLENDSCRVDNPAGIVAQADAPDLAAGMLAHRDDPDKLREWAMFIQAADIELAADDHPHGEVVLDALWDAAFRTSLSPETIAILREIVREERE